MLAKTPRTLVYLTAAELGITERERAGLIEVRDDLASGRVRHVKTDYWRYPTSSSQTDVGSCSFNMDEWSNSYPDCGTVQCIGGFMEARGAINARWDHSNSLTVLFHPSVRGWRSLNPDQAVRAIDHFLAGAGSECWPLALSDEPT